MRREGTGAAVTVAALLWLSSGPPARPQDSPCAATPRYRALDLLLGDWIVRDAAGAGAVVASSRIEKDLGGCLLREAWIGEGAGPDARVSLVFDPAAGRWRALGINDRGELLRLDLTPGADDRIELAGERVSSDGSRAELRGRIERAPGSAIREVLEVRQPSGWAPLLDVLYTPRGAGPATAAALAPATAPETAPDTAPDTAPVPPAPATARVELPAAATPARIAAAPTETPVAQKTQRVAPRGSVAVIPAEVPEPEPADTGRRGSVESRSRRAKNASIEVESPMVLRFPMGDVLNLPSGYSWSTDEVAAYVCEGARIPSVRVENKGKRGSALLAVTVAVQSAGMLRRFGLQVDLLEGEEVVASDAAPQFAVGGSLTTQAQEGVVTQTLDLQIERERLEALYRDGQQPSLQVTLTVH